MSEGDLLHIVTNDNIGLARKDAGRMVIIASATVL